MSFCSIHFAVVQPTKRNTALARLVYQTCSLADDRFGRIDYRRYADCRVGGGVLLPVGAPTEFAEWEHFFMAAAFRETRRDAQEGRTVDFALPRAVPRALLLPLAAFALLPFVEGGMAVRVDVESVCASDGEANPHAHCWLAQRVLGQDGFGFKERSWNALFRRGGGRYARAVLAGRITLGCAMLGVEAYVDPRCNAVKGAGIPEQRLPRPMFCAHNEGRYVAAVEALKASRRLRRDRKAPQRIPEPELARMTVTNAAVYRVGEQEAAELRRRFADAAREAGYELNGELDAASGLPTVSLTGTSVAFDGRAFEIAATGNSEDAAIVARFVRRLGWPALVVEGGARLADLMAIAAASEGVFMVNRAPSAGARDLIARAFFHEMKAAIARHDPLGVAAKFLADHEATKACTEVVGVAVAEVSMQADAASEDDLRSAADPVGPNVDPVQPGKVAEPASMFAPIAATADHDAGAVAAGADVRRAAGSPSEAIDDLESLPDDDSWKIRPDASVLAQIARSLQDADERQRQRLQNLDGILRRTEDRSSALRSGERRPPSGASVSASTGNPKPLW